MTLLSKFEYNIFKTIQKRPDLSSKEISKYCKESPQIVDNRISPLKRKLYVEIGYSEKLHSETYRITTEGLQALSDYEADESLSFWRKTEDRFWKFTPIVISALALIVSYLAYSKSQDTERYVKIEITKEAIENINGNHSSQVFDSKNSLEKNGMQQKK